MCPFLLSRNSEGSAPMALTRDGSPLRVLVVEDDSVVAHDLAITVEEHRGRVVAIADNAAAAVALARETAPDVALVDTVLHGHKDGVTAAEALRNALDLPVVFCTGSGDPRTLQRVRAFGLAEVVLKPAAPDDLCAAILRAVVRRH